MQKLIPIVLAATAAAVAAHFVLSSWMDEASPALIGGVTGGIAGAVATVTSQATRTKREC